MAAEAKPDGSSSGEGRGSPHKEDGGGKVGFRARIEHFTWANFTCTQSTGGIAVLLSETPHQFHGLQTAGVVVFILNLVLFAVFCAAMATRFILHPYTIKKSLTTVPECLFIGPFFLSCATIIMCSKRSSYSVVSSSDKYLRCRGLVQTTSKTNDEINLDCILIQR